MQCTHLQPPSGSIWVGDVGAGTNEEITNYPSPIAARQVYNGGWPCYEGPDPYWFFSQNQRCVNQFFGGSRDLYTFPTIAWTHTQLFMGGGQLTNDIQSAVTAVVMLSGENGLWPDEYANSLWFSDYAKGGVFVVPRNAEGQISQDNIQMVLDSSVLGMVDLQEGPDGALYGTNLNLDAVMRISYAAPDQPPEMVVTADEVGGKVPLTIQFDASRSYDSQQRDLTFEWNFGQGWVAGEAVNQYTFATKGQVEVQVRGQAVGSEIQGVGTIDVFPGYYIDVVISTPGTPNNTWSMGDSVNF